MSTANKLSILGIIIAIIGISISVLMNTEVLNPNTSKKKEITTVIKTNVSGDNNTVNSTNGGDINTINIKY